MGKTIQNFYFDFSQGVYPSFDQLYYLPSQILKSRVLKWLKEKDLLMGWKNKCSVRNAAGKMQW